MLIGLTVTDKQARVSWSGGHVSKLNIQSMPVFLDEHTHIHIHTHLQRTCLVFDVCLPKNKLVGEENRGNEVLATGPLNASSMLALVLCITISIE